MALFESWSDLEFPERDDLYEAAQSFVRDGKLFARSTIWLSSLLLKPLAKFLYFLLLFIYHHGLEQSQKALIVFWKWQSTRNLREILLEVVIVGLLLLLYRFRKLLQTYWTSASIRMDRYKRQTIKTYRDGLNALAKVSLLLATMTPHGLLAASLLTFKALFPSLFTWIAVESPLLFVLKYLWPTVMTLQLIYEESVQPEAEKENTKVKKETKRPKEGFPKAKKTFDPSLVEQTSQEFWSRYWLVFGSIEFTKTILRANVLTSSILYRFAILSTIGRQLETVFFVFIYVIPKIMPIKIGDRFLPEGRPVHLLSDWIVPLASAVREHVASVVSKATWDTYVASQCRKLCQAFQYIGFLSEPWAEWMVHVAEEGRPLLIPSISMLLPFGTAYGIAYVQFIIPMKQPTPIKYWVLQCFVSAFLSFFNGILAWIPFASRAIFVFYCWLTLEKSTTILYSKLEEDMQYFGILPGEKKSSHIGRILQTIIQQLPRGN